MAGCPGEQTGLIMKQTISAHPDQLGGLPAESGYLTRATLITFDHAAERRLQRRAMLSMWLAMAVMALGVSGHLNALDGHQPLTHGVVDHLTALDWLAWLLTTATLWQARGLLPPTWHALRRGQVEGATLVGLGALAAYIVSLVGLGTALAETTYSGRLYFDVTAMGLAWLLAGAAQRADLRRRYVTTLEQLMLFDVTMPACPMPSANRSSSGAGWVAVLLLGWALLTVGLQIGTGQPLAAALIAGLAVLALGCPCTLGMARSSAAAAGAASAAAAGWVVVDEAAFWPGSDACVSQPAALCLGPATPGSYERIARTVRRAAWLNRCWAVGFNLLLLPLALLGPVDPLLPAASMLLAWALIALTNRSIG